MLVDLLLRPEVAWVAGGGMMALAALLLYVAPRDRVMRAFSAFLLLRGTGNLPFAVYDNERVILLPFIAVWFLVEYHRRARLRPGRAWTLPALGLLGAAALWAWRSGVALPDWLHIVNILFPARFLAYAAIAAFLAWDAVAHKKPNDRWPLLLVSGAFALDPLYYAGVLLSAGRFLAVPASPYAIPYFIIVAAAATIALTALLLLLQLAARKGASLRRQVVGYEVAIAAVLASLLWLQWRSPAPLGFDDPWALAFDRVWTLPVPFVVGYVLLRHRLFDLDLRLKSTLFGGIILGAFSAAFFVAQELLEDLIAGDSPFLGLVGAGLLALGFMPLQRLARTLVGRIMPGVERTPDYMAHRKAEVYRSTYESMVQDGEVSAKDRRILEAVRSNLGLSAEDAARIEHGAVHTAQPGPPSASGRGEAVGSE